MPIGCITAGPKSVTRAVDAASLRHGTIGCANQTPLPRLYSTTALSGAISSARALLYCLLLSHRIEKQTVKEGHGRSVKEGHG